MAQEDKGVAPASYQANGPLARRMLSIEEASKYLALSTWTVRRMIWTGHLPHVRRGRRILLDLRDLDTWIDREKVNGV
jgi:excisionase family DNA binding protein